MNDREINDKVLKLKEKCRPLTNCYSSDTIARADRLWSSGGSLAFSYKDNGVNRIIFFAENEVELAKLIDVTPCGKYCIEYVTKNPDEWAGAFATAKLVTRLKKVVNPDCSSLFENSQMLQYIDDSVSAFPTYDDVREINELLWKTFNTEVSHLLTDEQMKESIDRHEVTVHRDESGLIDAVLQVIIQPKKFYTNQAVNLGKKHIINAMLMKRLQEYYEAGGKYIYCWVEEKNIPALWWNAQYGMKHDGTWNILYCVKK